MLNPILDTGLFFHLRKYFINPIKSHAPSAQLPALALSA